MWVRPPLGALLCVGTKRPHLDAHQNLFVYHFPMSKRFGKNLIALVLTALFLTPAAYAAVAPGSIKFNGNQYAISNLNFASVPGSGNFTYEFWFYIDDAARPNQGLMNTRSGNSKDGIDAQVNPNSETTGILGVSYKGRWLEYTDPGTIKSKTWYHLALVRTSTANLNIYFNGALQRSLTLDGDGRSFTSTHLIIGAIGGSSSMVNAKLTGNISNFRYSKSVIYSAAFTPVRTTLEATADTKVLLQTLNDSTFLDDTAPGSTGFTNTGGAVASELSPFIDPISDEEVAAAAKRAAEAKRLADRESARLEILRSIKEGKAITITLFNRAEIDGANDKNIEQINSEISRLSDTDKETISPVAKILFKYMTADQISKGYQVSFYNLQTIFGPLKSEPAYKSALNVGLRNAGAEQKDSIEKIQSLVREIEKRVSDRKADIVARLARIRASILR